MPRRATAPLNVQISRSLRRRIDEAREHSGRTLTGEVEARLRASLRQSAGDELLLLRIDDGLMAHVDALARNGRGGMFGNVEQTAIYLIRTQIIDFMSSDGLRDQIVPYLREPWRRNNSEAARIYRALNDGKAA